MDINQTQCGTAFQTVNKNKFENELHQPINKKDTSFTPSPPKTITAPSASNLSGSRYIMRGNIFE